MAPLFSQHLGCNLHNLNLFPHNSSLALYLMPESPFSSVTNLSHPRDFWAVLTLLIWQSGSVYHCCRYPIVFWFFETQSYPVAQTGFELKKTLLPQLPEQWHCRLVPPSLLCDSCTRCMALLFYKPTQLKMRQEHRVLYYCELTSSEVAKGDRGHPGMQEVLV